MRGLILALLASACLSGCITTQEMPLAPNVVRLDTQARGYLFTGQTVPATMRAAALATIKRGYTHFKFANAQLGQGSQAVGAISTANGGFSGTYGSSFYNGNVSGISTTNVIRAPTAGAAATVVMFHANEPGAQGAFDAAQVMKRYPQ